MPTNQFLEQTLVLIKPDAIERGLTDEILARFTRAGLLIVDQKKIRADQKLAQMHYPVTEEWYLKVGNNTISDCQKYQVSVIEAIGSDDPIEIGKRVHGWNVAMLLSGDVMACIIEGVHAVEAVRKLVGSTIPLFANPGTIRGDYSTASALSENINGFAIRNLVHASGTLDEAKREIELWFGGK
jgi:nucleoside-diphosphate kinase